MISIGAGAIGVILWLVLWLVFNHFWIGAIAGILVAAFGHGIVIRNRNRPLN